MTVLLDTHVWLWWLVSPEQLSARRRAALATLAARRALGISAISLWEAQMLVAKGRLRVPIAFSAWLRQAADPAVVTVVPMDVPVVLALDDLPASFHGDPADRVIVATARAHGVPLATEDAAIRRSRLVRQWRP